MNRTRRGFTAVELLVTVALIAVLIAVLVPVVVNRLRDGQVSALAQSVDSFAQGIENYRADIRRYPTRLSQLTTLPTTAYDACGRVTPTAFLSKWRGPYIQTNMTASGFRVSDALVRDSIKSSPQPMTTTVVGFLLIEVEEVDSIVAQRLEDAYDSDDDFTAGLVRWTNQGNDRGLLVFGVRIRGC